MHPIAISILTICGVDELPAQNALRVTHVLSLLDPGWPEIEAFGDYGEHSRKVMYFHDIIEPQDDRKPPQAEHVAEIVRFGSELAASRDGRSDGHLLVHCHMGISRSTAAMLILLAQTYPQESEDRLFERLRQIRPQAWPNSRMIGFADDLLGRNGRLLSALSRHYGCQLKVQPKFTEWMTNIGRTRELAMATFV
jgi:predicted protein tyrosine phosphatase